MVKGFAGARNKPTGWRFSTDPRGPLRQGINMNVSQQVDRQTFLANLRRSGLLTEAQFTQVTRNSAAITRGRALAAALVQKGLLTRFQAEQLLAGVCTGFRLGPYRILDQLGRGGMGRVYKAEHFTMKRVVALKVLAPHLVDTERARDLFLREVRAVAQLVHPNIVTAFDASEENGQHYLALEYVDGPNLDQLVKKQGPLAVGLACDYIRQTAVGLQCAHQLGMVHRDIKPANILVQRRGMQEDSPGLIKISDFGLARLHAPNLNPEAFHHAGTIVTRMNTVMGTPDYLSPEQARDLHNTDIRSDLYSLGCTFYFLLTGQAPFAGGTAVEKLIRHSTEQPRPITDFRTDLPAALIDILEGLLAKQPDDRFQDPVELIAALEPYAVGGPIPWAPPTSGVGLDLQTSEMMDQPASSSSILDEPTGETSTVVNVAHEVAPTPIITPIVSRPLSSAHQGIAGGRVKLAVLCATGIVFALLALLAVLLAVRG
jgi:serine/threonine protein kinase